MAGPRGGGEAGYIRTALHTPGKSRFLLETAAGRVITFFRSDAPIPIVINRVKLATAIVLGVVAPLVLALSAVVFSSNRRCR